MSKVLVHLIAAARPNFMKVSPLYHTLKKEAWFRPLLIHTGQHYDDGMSDTFLRELGLPSPDLNLGVGSGSHAGQTAGVMLAYEKVCMKEQPDWIVVVGDVNSTMSCALAAKKLCLNVAHVEAGLRSRDRTMPEEINRIVTDSISDLLLTPSKDADENLLREGIAKERVIRVGNIMIDSYEMLRGEIEKRNSAREFGLENREFGVVTLHRPANVDYEDSLRKVCDVLTYLSDEIPLVFPVHPRTVERLHRFHLWDKLEACNNLHLVNPLGYIDFMSLVREANFVITDSGGLQEETTYLGIPCLTLRGSTERPITVWQGSNRLVTVESILEHFRDIMQKRFNTGNVPELWDGHTAERVVYVLKKFLGI